MNRNRHVTAVFCALVFLIAFIMIPTYGTLSSTWNADPEISGHSNSTILDENNVEKYLEPWGSFSWGFRAFTWYNFIGGGHGKIDTAKITYTNGIVYMYGYQHYTIPPWVGVVSISQGHIYGDNDADEGWKKPTAINTYGKQIQVEMKYWEGTYGNDKNWAWNFGAARLIINIWLEDRTNHKELVLDLCVDEKIGWGGVAGMSGTMNYFVGVWNSTEKTSLGGGWFKINVDVDYYLSRALNYFRTRNGIPLYDKTNMWLHGAEFVIELYNAKRETQLDYYYLSYS